MSCRARNAVSFQDSPIDPQGKNMRKLRWLLVTITLIAVCALAVGCNVDPVVTMDHGPHALAQQAKPYVIVVSLDGFRYDDAQRHGRGG